MSTPFVQLSSEETRQQTLQNIQNGEAEPGSYLELEQQDEAPLTIDHKTAEAAVAYNQRLSEDFKNDLRSLLGLKEHTVKTVEVGDRLISRQEVLDSVPYEMVKSVEVDTAVKVESESQAEKKVYIGERTELTFNIPQKIEAKSESDNQVKEDSKSSLTENAPSSLGEFIGDNIKPAKWAGKGLGLVFGFMKGLFGGLMGIAKESTKVEHKKTEAQVKAENKKKVQNAEKSAFFQRVDKAQAEAQGAKQNVVSKVLVRLGVAGMGMDAMNSYLGQNRNLNSEEVNVYTAFEIAKKAEEAKKNQEKQVKDMEMAQAQGPTINIDAAVEGGTGGGKANISSVASAG